MALDFSRYLDVPVEDIEAPKPLPAGTSFATIAKWEGREVDYKDGSGKTPVVTISLPPANALAALADPVVQSTVIAVAPTTCACPVCVMSMNLESATPLCCMRARVMFAAPAFE